MKFDIFHHICTRENSRFSDIDDDDDGDDDELMLRSSMSEQIINMYNSIYK